MDRRKFIKSAGIATGAAAATTLATPAIAQATKDMVIVSTWPRDFPGLGTGAQRLAARIGELTEGRINVQYFAASERVGRCMRCSEPASRSADVLRLVKVVMIPPDVFKDVPCHVALEPPPMEADEPVRHPWPDLLQDDALGLHDRRPTTSGDDRAHRRTLEAQAQDARLARGLQDFDGCYTGIAG